MFQPTPIFVRKLVRAFCCVFVYLYGIFKFGLGVVDKNIRGNLILLRSFSVFTTMNDINEDTLSSPSRSRRPSVEPLVGAKNAREPPRLLHEMQGLKLAGTSRRPSIINVERIRPHHDLGISGLPGSAESSTPGTPIAPVTLEDLGIPFTTPAQKSPTPKPPPPPDFDKPPYSKPIGPIFQGDEWTPLLDRLENKVIKVLVACETLGQGLNLPIQRLRPAGLHYNVLALDEQTIREITRDCWWIMYEIIVDALEWKDLMSRKQSLLERLKRNLRQSQPQVRWDVPCDILISLGFTEPWLYE